MATNEDSIPSQYVQGFRANLNLSPQQTDSRLLAAVDSDLNYSEPGTGFNADDVGTSDPEDVLTRVADTPDKFVGMSRRVGYFTPFHDSAWLDNVDKARELEDPTNPVMQAIMAGRWRKVDFNIINGSNGVGGMFGSALTKADENTAPSAIAFPAAQIIAVNDQTSVHQGEVIPAASADYGMSVGKMIKAGMMLDDSDLEGERYTAFGPAQMADLMRTTPATSTYYNSVQALMEGKITEFLGFKIIKVPRKRLPITGVNRQIPFWIKSAMVYRGRPITNARISVRTDKSDTPQAFYKTEHASVRRYDAGVVQALCKES